MPGCDATFSEGGGVDVEVFQMLTVTIRCEKPTFAKKTLRLA